MAVTSRSVILFFKLKQNHFAQFDVDAIEGEDLGTDPSSAPSCSSLRPGLPWSPCPPTCSAPPSCSACPKPTLTPGCRVTGKTALKGYH